jgi:predicted ATP-grasp superfamily ATP-dependent carboligase
MTDDQATPPNPDGVILFSGFNQRSVVTMCRTLEACNITYHIIAHTPQDTMFQTAYASRINSVRSNPALDIDDLCTCIESVRAGASKRFVIAPTSEAMNLFLLEHRKRIEQSGDILPLVSEALYREISDKSTFGARCREYDIRVPEELASLDTPKLPVVAKPYSEISPDGRHHYPILVYTEQDWKQFASRPDRNLYFLQRYIHGSSYYLQYYFHASGQVDRFSMRNLVQQPEGKSIVAAEAAYLHLDKTYRVFETLLQDAGFRGLIMVELMFENDSFYMIEANPRMWGPAQLMADAGSNLYVSFINDLFGYDISLDICGKMENPLYFWWAGFWAPQLQGKPMKWHCSPSEFWEKYPEFLKAEIYCQKDTRGIFLQEAQALPIPMRYVYFMSGQRGIK